jgi:hypothetical protein
VEVEVSNGIIGDGWIEGNPHDLSTAAKHGRPKLFSLRRSP